MHGVNPAEQHCPLCFGYRSGAIFPTSAPIKEEQKSMPRPSSVKR